MTTWETKQEPNNCVTMTTRETKQMITMTTLKTKQDVGNQTKMITMTMRAEHNYKVERSRTET